MTKGWIEDRHDLLTARNRGTSILVLRRFPLFFYPCLLAAHPKSECSVLPYSSQFGEYQSFDWIMVRNGDTDLSRGKRVCAGVGGDELWIGDGGYRGWLVLSSWEVETEEKRKGEKLKRIGCWEWLREREGEWRGWWVKTLQTKPRQSWIWLIFIFKI